MASVAIVFGGGRTEKGRQMPDPDASVTCASSSRTLKLRSAFRRCQPCQRPLLLSGLKMSAVVIDDDVKRHLSAQIEMDTAPRASSVQRSARTISGVEDEVDHVQERRRHGRAEEAEARHQDRIRRD